MTKLVVEKPQPRALQNYRCSLVRAIAHTVSIPYAYQLKMNYTLEINHKTDSSIIYTTQPSH